MNSNENPQKISVEEIYSKYFDDSEIVVVEEDQPTPPKIIYSWLSYRKIKTPQGTYNQLSLSWPDNRRSQFLIALLLIVFILGIIHLATSYPEFFAVALERFFQGLLVLTI